MRTAPREAPTAGTMKQGLTNNPALRIFPGAVAISELTRRPDLGLKSLATQSTGGANDPVRNGTALRRRHHRVVEGSQTTR